ncbi:MAG: exo-alpha-sialidase [Pirellulales bacterium]|nr:exo-alpha-sialidase [Pirellulales bacterium]
MVATRIRRVVLETVFLVALSMLTMPGVGAEPVRVDVFVNGDGYNAYRIPSLICTPKGTLLAFCEGRRGGDQSPTDMVLKRSLDGGKTWLPMQVIVKALPEAVMDPTAVIERTSGKVILVYDRWPEMPKGKKLGEFKRVPGLGRDSVTTWITTSNDEGVTWSTPLDITATTKKPEWTEAGHGPGLGLQMRSGRIVIPCFENRPDGPGWGTCWNFSIYSDDHGKTWQLSNNEAGPGVNETQVVELTDGTLLLNMRSDDPKKGCRLGATSKDGGKTWSPLFDIPELPDPCCQASMLRYSWADKVGGKSRILYCGPGTKQGRHTGTVRVSYNEAKTWPVAKVICKDYFGYCCLTVMPDGTIACLFESVGCSRIACKSFSLDWLTDGKDSLEH